MLLLISYVLFKFPPPGWCVCLYLRVCVCVSAFGGKIREKLLSLAEPRAGRCRGELFLTISENWLLDQRPKVVTVCPVLLARSIFIAYGSDNNSNNVITYNDSKNSNNSKISFTCFRADAVVFYMA